MSNVIVFIILGVIAISAIGSLIFTYRLQRGQRTEAEIGAPIDVDNSLVSAELKVEMHEQMKIREESMKAAVQEHMLATLSPLQSAINNFKDSLNTQHNHGSTKMVQMGTIVKELSEQHQKLVQETHSLSSALKGSPRAQGEFGELQLERLLQHSGLVEGIGYDKKVDVSDADGKRAVPDILINLPDEGYIVVDSKVSIPAYFKLLEVSDPKEQEQAVKTLKASMKTHVNNLATKNYVSNIGKGSPNMVFMFTPLEGALQEVIKYDNDFLYWAWQKRIFLLTPLSLIPVLNIVAQLWRQSKQDENVHLIMEKASEMLDALSEFFKEFEDVGKALKKATTEYEKAHLHLIDGKHSVWQRAHNIKELGVASSKKMPESLSSPSSNN